MKTLIALLLIISFSCTKQADRQTTISRANGNSSTQITPEKAQMLIGNYMEDRVLNAGMAQSDVIKAWRIDRSSVESILQNSSCVYLRMYLGKADVNGDPTMIVVGVNESNENLLDEVYDNSDPCPNNCPTTDFTGK